MKKFVSFIVISFILIGCIFPNGVKETSNKSTMKSDKVVLNYYAWTEGDYLQDIVDNYNAISDVATVNLVQFPSGDYENKLTTMMSGKNNIDLYNMRSTSLLNKFISAGALVNITNYIKNSDLDISAYGPSYSEVLYDNKYYALPYRFQSYALFYNKKVFEEQGLPYPDNLTWEEYAQLAKKLTHGQGVNKVYGGMIPAWLFAPYMTLQEHSNILDDDLGPTRDWLIMLNRFYNIDNSHMTYSDMKSTSVDNIDSLCTGKCVLMPNGEWSLGDIKKFIKNNPSVKDTFELGIATLPQVKKTDNPVSVGGVSTFIGINSTSKNIDAAFDFAKYVAGEEAGVEIAKYGMIPAYTSDKTTKAYVAAVGVSGSENLLNVNRVPEGLFTPEFSELQSVYCEERELYLIGEQTLDETMKNFKETRDSILNK